jgi:hypothetical protein
MRHRTLGILGGALLVGGVVLGIASAVASNRIAPVGGTAMQRPALGAFPRHYGPGQPGPFFGNLRQGRGFPGPGQQGPIVPGPGSSASPAPST